MDIEIGAEAKDKAFNRRVAMTVVALSIFMGIAHVKDDNLVQAMQQAQARGLDAWGEYQATKTKQHLDENSLADIQALAAIGGARTAAVSAAETARLQKDIAKYRAEVPVLKKQAEGYQAQYDALNVHDDQFDASDALISIAISVAAVAALVEAPWALWVAWTFGGFGVIMGLSGFFGWSLHSDTLARILS
jgi:hypothetical protein